ncbi:hypothetical protein [Chamaesiphon polymorphus]|uniref:Uncharacterized protein n=1 Tax=Chamaesiphon polymorphus CCALA 037 TaxID=2107692 RepID=A0A2T1GI72_9CYAN|nr:hypothetical protein [Chamaesiphon polymorphus]PSB57444.1 hypothetical protein C7B77_08290 [Chamaesiphon polymorphus CCALA 037]
MKQLILAIAVAVATNYPLVNMPVRAQTRSISLDEMTTVLATLVAVGNSCPQKYRSSGDAPLDSIVSAYGYNLDDFNPNGKYGKSMELKMARSIKFFKTNGTVKACTTMRNFIEQNLPELYSSNASDEKIKLANEATQQHYTCYSNMLQTGTGESKDCDDRFRQQLNQNGLCEYVSDRLRQRFCKNSSDADGKFK